MNAVCSELCPVVNFCISGVGSSGSTTRTLPEVFRLTEMEIWGQITGWTVRVRFRAV
jgi:hypothetical protein